MSTRSNGQSGTTNDRDRPAPLRSARRDPAEEVAQVALARRELMLAVHRFRLRREDLEDCYSQATLELLVSARAGRSFATRAHIANAIELRFLSRVRDRRRAVSGRSPSQAAMESAIALDGEEAPIEIEDRRSEPERVLMLREELKRLQAHASRLTEDQRLVLACQLSLGMGCEEFCRIHRWSPEKYRKVAQRGRARLKSLMDQEQAVPARPSGSDRDPGTNL